MTYFNRDLKTVRAPDFDKDTFVYGIIVGVCMGIILGVLLK